MDILLTGSTQIATMLAIQLSQEGHNVTVMDDNYPRLNAIKEKADVEIIVARPTYPQSFKQANAHQKNLLIAVHELDEMNMLSCQVAHSLFQIPKKIARISSPHYLVRHELFGDSDLPIDVFINSDGLVIQHIEHNIHYDAHMSVSPFGFNELCIIDLTLNKLHIQHRPSLCNITPFLPSKLSKVISVVRHSNVLTSKNIDFLPQDRLFILTEKSNQKSVLKLFDIHKKDKPNIMIAGGGNIGATLGKRLSTRYHVKLIEQDTSRCYELVKTAPYLNILNADATDKKFLIDEGIDNIDCFCATTGDDEDNIISSIQANHLGAKQTVCLISRDNYLDIFNQGTPNRLILSHRLISQHIFQHIHPGQFIENKPLLHGSTRLILAEVSRHSAILNTLKLPKNTTLLAIRRSGRWLIPNDELQIDDHVLLLSLNEDDISALDLLFQ
ncbi:MAG: NAD-binding protein [Candidatus Comchoanobacterales bacterium]